MPPYTSLCVYRTACYTYIPPYVSLLVRYEAHTGLYSPVGVRVNVDNARLLLSREVEG